MSYAQFVMVSTLADRTPNRGFDIWGESLADREYVVIITFTTFA